MHLQKVGCEVLLYQKGIIECQPHIGISVANIIRRQKVEKSVNNGLFF